MAESTMIGLERPISKNDALDQPMANKRAREGAGEALGDLLVTETMKQAQSMKQFVVSLAALDADEGTQGLRQGEWHQALQSHQR
jgi:hypothetical protein